MTQLKKRKKIIADSIKTTPASVIFRTIMNRKKISVVLPCYNPDINWAVNILIRYNEIGALLPNADLELILVNDGSSNNISISLDYLKSHLPNCTVIDYKPNRGKGFAIRKGVEKASGDWIIYTDVDFPYTNQSFVDVVNALEQNDISVGTRGTSYYDNIPTHRAAISKLLRFLIKTSLRIPTDDTQGGLKGMRANVKNTFLKTEINRYLFDLEFVCIAAKQKLSIALVPVVLNETTVVRKMNLKVVSKEMLNFFKVYTKMLFQR